MTIRNVVKWVRDNALGGIVGTLALSSLMAAVSWVTGSCEVVLPLVRERPWECLSCALVSMGAGALVGLTVSRAWYVRMVREVTEQAERDIAEASGLRSLDEMASRFVTMPFSAKMLCAGIWQSGGIEREPGPTMPSDEAVSASRRAGFVMVEPTNDFGRVRFSATGDLTRLFTERADLYERVCSDFARGRFEMRGGRLNRIG